MSIPVQETNQEVIQNSKEDNLRKQREHYERIIAEKEKALQEAQSKASTFSQKQVEEEDDDEPYVDQKRLKYHLSKFEQDMDKKIDQKAEMKAKMILEEEKRQAYLKERPDFNQVMSEEVLNRFETEHSEVARRILRMPEGFDRQALVYETVKSMGLHQPKAKEPTVQDKINSNRRSPYYQPSGVGASPYSQVGDFSEAGQKNAYSHLQQLKKRLGSF